MELTYEFLLGNPDYNGVVHTMLINSYSYTVSDYINSIHIFAQIRLCNKYNIRCLKFFHGRASNISQIGFQSNLPADTNKFANTVRCIIAESNSHYFFCMIIAQFIERSATSKVVCKLVDMLSLLAYELKTYMVKETNQYLREVHFEERRMIRTNDVLEYVFIEFTPLVPKWPRNGLKYDEDGYDENDDDEDNMVKTPDILLDAILARNMTNFKLKQSSVISLLALKKYGKNQSGIYPLHKDTILLIAHIVWNSKFPV